MSPRRAPRPDRGDPLRAARGAVSTGHFREAWDRLVRLSEAVRDGPEWLLLAAIASWRLGEFARSRTTALQARDRYRALADADGEMRAENVAAAGAFALGDLDDASRGFTRALTLADTARDNQMIARCANNLGNVAYYHARYAAALGYYRLAIANFEKVSSPEGLAEGWLNAAIVWREHGDPHASRAAAERAVAAAERAGSPRLFGQALAAAGETSAALGDFALAQVQAERALRTAQAQHDPLGEADATRILALIALGRGDVESAEALGRQALAAAVQLTHPWTVAEVQRALADIATGAGRPDAAVDAFRQAAAAYDRMGAGERARAARARAESLDP